MTLQQQVGEFTRILDISAAYDRRHKDPSKNYGIHCVDMRFVLKGAKGATQFVLYTNWYLPENNQPPKHPMPADLGYHSRTPHYEDHPVFDCEYTDTGKCYYDGSSLNAERVYKVMLEKGMDGVWEELESYYHSTFAE